MRREIQRFTWPSITIIDSHVLNKEIRWVYGDKSPSLLSLSWTIVTITICLTDVAVFITQTSASS
jgi:hypothetical protein